MEENFENFSCVMSDIESIREKFEQIFMIENYCGTKFKLLNLIDIYYRFMNTNAVMMLVLTVLCVLVIFYQTKLLIKRFLSKGIIQIQRELQVDYKLVALLLITTVNAASELFYLTGVRYQIIDTFSFFSILIGAVIFTSTIGLAFIISSNRYKFLRLPAFSILIELGNYFFVMVFILMCGYF